MRQLTQSSKNKEYHFLYYNTLRLSHTNRNIHPATMKFLFIVMISIVMHLLSTIATPTTSVGTNFGANETDRLALLAIKSKIRLDPNGVLNSWNNSFHFCRWEGIRCGRRHKRVTILNLSNNSLTGSLSPYIGNLSFLKVIRLHDNTLQGTIPSEVGRLFRLQKLFLYNNSLEGQIPTNLSQCTSLTVINIYSNNFFGEIPRELASLIKLQYFWLHLNKITGGIPRWIGNLTSLVSISARDNNLGGRIPDIFNQLKNLEEIGLSSNQISGSIPPSIYNLSSLTILSLRNNHLQDTLPLDFGLMLPNLQILQLDTNNFSGPFPPSVSNCSALVSLQISFNNFKGKIAVNFGGLRSMQKLRLGYNNFGNTGESDEMDFIYSLANCSDLAVLALEENQLRGVLRESFGNLSTQLSYLTLSQNHIFGSLPETMGDLVGLQSLYLEGNEFTGRIPTTIGNLQKLQVVVLSRNKFSGTIPSSIGNLSLLNELYLENNMFDGTIPSSLGSCLNLQLLNLAQNNISGRIPKSLFGLSSLSKGLGLDWNHFSGSLPQEIGNLKNLGSLYISNNDLSGEIPSTLGTCSSLEYLHLEGNMFQGSIPQSFTSLRGIQELDLSHNNLSGEIPRFLEQFALKYLNLSFNSFEGEVPMKGVFANTSAISVFGNNELCGGIPKLQLPKCTYKSSKKRRKMPLALIIVLSIVCSFFGVTMVLLSVYFSCIIKKRKMAPSDPALNEVFPKVSYEMLLKATDGFCSANLIGVGSFGSVFKGILEDDHGAVVAVKVLNLHRRGADKSFMAECEALRNVRHRNLVKIITACSSVDYQGNDFKALLYEFMPNGSLESWLHSSLEMVIEPNVPNRLGLLQRVNIAIDVASALDYLHNQTEKPIIHCDIKPSNILLNGDMIACVGDFGLARILLSEHSNSNESSSIGIKGTIGYAAPEYGLGSEISANGDVYSYGILLLELVTGKKPIDPMFNEGLNLHSYARMALPDSIMEIVEPTLLNRDEEYKNEAAIDTRERAKNWKRKEECLCSLVKIGVACSMELPQDRMDMSSVIHDLHSIKGMLQGTTRIVS